MNRRMIPGLSARISATRLSHIGSSDNPPWPSAILWISRGPRRLVNETVTSATCDCADALSAKPNSRLNNNQDLGSRMDGDGALTRRRVQPIDLKSTFAIKRRVKIMPPALIPFAQGDQHGSQ